jgi:hypothetical protein
VAAIDLGFLLAIVAFGWGLSLATYRLFALHHDWPMGSWQEHWPMVPTLVGVLCIGVAACFSIARAYGGYELSAVAIPVFGIAWAVFWTGFLRVGAQSALLLAPAALALLLLRWLG